MGGVHAAAAHAERRIGRTGLPASLVARLWTAAAAAAAAAWATRLGIGHHRPIVVAVPVLGAYGMVYFGAAYLLRVEECVGTLERVARFASTGTRLLS